MDRYYSKYNLNTFLNLSELKASLSEDLSTAELLDATIFWLTNLERKKYALKPFQFHPKLRQMALLHSNQMRLHHFFSHENPHEERYKTLTHRLDRVKDRTFDGFMTYGENIALYPTLKEGSFVVRASNGYTHFYNPDGTEMTPYNYLEYAQEVVKGWMNSPGHRANILNPSYEYLGCGCAAYLEKNTHYDVPYFYLTQNFGGQIRPISTETIRSTSNPRAENSIINNNVKRSVWGLGATKHNNMENDYVNEDMMPDSGYSPENGEEKTLCVFLLDNSGSMGDRARGSNLSKIEALNQGLQQFHNDILTDESSSQKVEVAVISFESTVSYLQQPALVQDFTMPVLHAMGGTDMVGGVKKAMEVVRDRKAYWVNHGVSYKRPWIIMITDGYANVDSIKDQVKKDAADKHFFFLPIAVDDAADMNVLNSLATNKAFKLGTHKFAEFFKWLSNSIGTIANAEEGSNVKLENPYETFAVN